MLLISNSMTNSESVAYLQNGVPKHPSLGLVSTLNEAMPIKWLCQYVAQSVYVISYLQLLLLSYFLKAGVKKASRELEF